MISNMESHEVIIPIKKWLLSKSKCTCCGRSLVKYRKERVNGNVLVTCDCRRVFVWLPEVDSFRRAFLEDVRQ
jgi:hypothetical protein